METARCLGCGASIFAKPGACPRCGFTRGTTKAQGLAFGLVIIAISALVYGMWSLIPQVMASL
jgi:hypothetical protein